VVLAVRSVNWSLLLISMALSDSDSLRVCDFLAGGDCGVCLPDLLGGERDVLSKVRC